MSSGASASGGPPTVPKTPAGGAIMLDEDSISKIIGDNYGFDKLRNVEEKKIVALTDPKDYIENRKKLYDVIKKNAVAKFKEVYGDTRVKLTEDQARKLASMAADSEIRIGLEKLEMEYPSGLISMSENALFKQNLGSSVLPDITSSETSVKKRGRPKGSKNKKNKKKTK
jgi:hypothetical protein